MAKYLSILFACMVVALSTLPCFLMDKCLFSGAVASCDSQSGQDDDGCGCDCCSPFMHCSTCPGCVRPVTVVFAKSVEPTPQRRHFTYVEPLVRTERASEWKPPRFFF